MATSNDCTQEIPLPCVKADSAYWSRNYQKSGAAKFQRFAVY
jgi:hypothetical protein